MKIENGIIIAESGKVLYEISSGETMGPDIVLGGEDMINNYAERDINEEDREKFKDIIWMD